MQKSIRSRKFTPRVSPKKLKTLFVTGKNDVLKTLSQVFLWEHEIPLVTNLLICNTRQTLVEWDFSTTNKTTKVDMQTKIGPPPYGLGPLQTNSPENYTVVMLPVTVCFISPSYCVAARGTSGVVVLTLCSFSGPSVNSSSLSFSGPRGSQSFLRPAHSEMAF